ncbi:MAG: galactonate dehydratase [Chloroflexota bacterium]
MKITNVETVLIDQYLFVQVHTDEGITGLGESGVWGFLGASAAVETLKGYLIGQDPLRIEHHAQYMYRFTHFRGSAIMGAISAVDIALWDIKGKYLGVPVYQLLGGKCRDKARVYLHVRGDTKEKLIQGCVDAKKAGFTAVGQLTPFLNEPFEIPYFKTHVDKMEDAIDTVRRYREAVGKEVDLCIEIHTRLLPGEAIVLGQGIEQYHPYFIEDPVLPDNIDAMAEVASKIRVPIATGERFCNIQEFEMLLSRNAAQYVRPDVCLCGGITAAKKVAALAESRYIGVIPHNPLSPVSTAACLQVAAAIPNFVLQEYPVGELVPPKSEIVKTKVRLEKGFLIIPDAPGIGCELAPDAKERYPFHPRKLSTRLHVDGSVIDQ